MAQDIKGNDLKVGDLVTIDAEVVKAVDGSDYVTVKTDNPTGLPAYQSTIAVRGVNVTKTGNAPAPKTAKSKGK